MTPELARILERQTEWAARAGLEIGGSRQTVDVDANLVRPPGKATLAELAASRRRPLGDGGRVGDPAKPGDLQILESTLALVCNVFEPGRDAAGPLAAACGGDPATRELSFCAPVDADGLACEIDLLFATDAAPGSPVGRPTALSACYAEPYRSERPRRDPANRVPSVWLDASRVWEALPTCRRLAVDLRAAPRRYEHAPAAELVLASACLTARFGYRGFRLVHVWYDCGGPSATRYRGELDRLRFRIGGEIDFRATTWQELCASLANGPEPALDDAQCRYLGDRYALG